MATKQAQYRIGTYDISFNKEHFGISDFALGNFICAPLTSTKALTRAEFPELFAKYPDLTDGVTVKDFFAKIPTDTQGLPLSEFEGYKLSYTTKPEELGLITNGKFNVNIATLDYAGNSNLAFVGHSHSSEDNDLVAYPADNVQKVHVELDPDGVEISALEDRDESFNFSPSSYVPGDVEIKLTNNTAGDKIKNNRRGSVIFVILGFKN